MSYKNKINIYIALFFFLTLILAVFLIHPVVSDIQKESKNLISQKESLLVLETKINNLKDFKDSLPNINVASVKIDNLLINDKAPVSFVRFLEKSAEETDIIMEISATQPGKSSRNTMWPTLSFQIKTLSSFPNFLEFLEKIESSSYLIDIESLNIKHVTESEITEHPPEKLFLKDVNVNFTIKVFAKNQ